MRCTQSQVRAPQKRSRSLVLQVATYSITDAGAAQDENGAGATSLVTGESAVKADSMCMSGAGAAFGARRCRCCVIDC